MSLKKGQKNEIVRLLAEIKEGKRVWGNYQKIANMLPKGKLKYQTVKYARFLKSVNNKNALDYKKRRPLNPSGALLVMCAEPTLQ